MSAYTPQDTEMKWSAFWERKGFFKADPLSQKPPYCISIPPPNVTGVLHMGHALVDTLQDVLIRWKRMSGFETLWVPGTDHAGIATQTVVERDQMAKTGKRRKDFPREAFLELVWRWKEESEERILGQLRKLGCSCDWDRLAFTMDEKRSQAVRYAFKKLFDAGLIHRDNYLVNWDPVTQTALADDEVEYEEQMGRLFHIRYALSDGSGFITVATTRPETLLGDTAVAVHPDDPRYRSWIGKTVSLPLTDRKIPIIADGMVDPSFGSGAVKITPAHDPNDYEVALRHNLPMINIMAPDGKISLEESRYLGLSMEEARNAIVEQLKLLALLEKETPHPHRVGISYRSKAVIEPYLSKQWFIRAAPFKEKLIKAVTDGQVTLIPKEWDSTYLHWIEQLRDWCISRQLWWGHQIPIWYRIDDPDTLICYGGEGLPPEVELDPTLWRQDEDVLDTWFSSALWPFAILGWPDQTPDLRKFYPNAVLVTGHDILFFWVARMLMLGEYLTGVFPFPETFLHGLIYGKSYWREGKEGSIAYLTAQERRPYDLGEPTPQGVLSKWEKMSKSKGNILDPLEIIETYGTDALRIALCSVATHARQIDLDKRRFEEYKHFINKLWNASKFILSHIDQMEPGRGIDSELFTLPDRWILSRLSRAIEVVEGHFRDYSFDKGAHEAYRFFWDECCAYYLELAKPTLFGKVGTVAHRHNTQCILLILLSKALRLFHPMIPFVTEELFHQLQEKIPSLPTDPYLDEAINALKSPACVVAPYPKPLKMAPSDPKIDAHFDHMDHIIGAIRMIRAEMALPPPTPIDLFIEGDEASLGQIKGQESMLYALIKIRSITYGKKIDACSATQRVGGVTLTIPLPKEMQLKEIERLKKQEQKLIQQKEQLQNRLALPEFMEKAPEPLVTKTKEMLLMASEELSAIESKLKTLEN